MVYGTCVDNPSGKRKPTNDIPTRFVVEFRKPVDNMARILL